MMWRYTTLLGLFLVTLILVDISEAKGKRRPHCRTRLGYTVVQIPGCLRKPIVARGCYGRCLSSARPLLNENGRFATSCSCCAQAETKERAIDLICGQNKKKTLRILVATKCICRPC